jgi:hypothetical protein
MGLGRSEITGIAQARSNTLVVSKLDSLPGSVRAWHIGDGPLAMRAGHLLSSRTRAYTALEEQRSEKYRHALIAVVSIGVRAGQLGGTLPGSRPAWYLTHEYLGRDQTCDLQELQVAPLTVPLFLEGHTRCITRSMSVPRRHQPTRRLAKYQPY